MSSPPDKKIDQEEKEIHLSHLRISLQLPHEISLLNNLLVESVHVHR